jgi:ribonuclease Z
MAEPFKVHILGCGSALPTLRHHASSQVVELRDHVLMLDCSEGTQMQLRRSRVRFTKLSHVFITHLHGDHCFGLIGMISTFGLLGRTAKLHVHGPEALGPELDRQIKFFTHDLGFEVVYYPVDTKVRQVVYEDRSMTVESIPLEHRVPCCGYLIREKASLPHIRREMMDCYGIPSSQVNNIKNGADWTTPEGELIANSLLTRPAHAPRSYAYCSDTKYMPRLHEMISGVTTLYHESTYDSSHEDRATLYHHSTAAQAAQVARDAHAQKLLLGHFSARYEREEVLLNEAKAIFPNSYLTNENLSFDV